MGDSDGDILLTIPAMKCEGRSDRLLACQCGDIPGDMIPIRSPYNRYMKHGANVGNTGGAYHPAQLFFEEMCVMKALRQAQSKRREQLSRRSPRDSFHCIVHRARPML